MRITGGRLRGRRIKAPAGVVRPTQDRVKEALFAMLGTRVAGVRFLDLFAGSGAVGLEAWSRGAGFVCWVESDRRVLSVLKGNVEHLCESGVRISGCDAVGFVKKRFAGRQFDIIFADPPYDRVSGIRHPEVKGRNEGRGWAERLLNAVREGDMLVPGGLFILEDAVAVKGAECLEHESGNRGLPALCPSGWVVVSERAYGDTKLRFFRIDESGGAESLQEGGCS